MSRLDDVQAAWDEHSAAVARTGPQSWWATVDMVAAVPGLLAGMRALKEIANLFDDDDAGWRAMEIARAALAEFEAGRDG